MDSALLNLANSILAKIPGSARVNKVKDINAALFVSLYEGLFAETLPDVIAVPKSAADEAHNVQAVIDTLSLDILNTSLSHLSGEAVVSGDRAAVQSLLEVFEWLFEYILERIGSEASSEVGDGEKSRDLDDPDLVTSEVIDSILQRELARSHNNGKNSKVTFASGTKSGELSRSVNSTAELIALGASSRDASVVSPEKTADVIALGDSRFLHTTPPTRGPRTGDTQPQRLSGSGRESQWSLSTGPLSPDTPNGRSDSRHSNGGLHDSATDDKRGYNSTAELIRESEELERRYGTVSPHERPNTSATNGSALEGSLSSSTCYPRPLSARELQQNADFHDLGSRPLSARSAYDSLSASMPTGHQYHSFTHHLYHHYNPVTNVLDPLSQSLPVRPQQLHGKVTRDTQVTPGRFLQQSPEKAAEGEKSSVQPSADRYSQSGVPGARSSKAKSQSYDNLRHLLQQTMSMSQEALRSSPLKNGTAPSVRPSDDPGDDQLSRRLRETLQKLHSSEDSGPERTEKPRQRNVQSILSPGRKAGSKTAPRKVSFLTTRDSSQPARSPVRSSPAKGKSAVGSSPLKRSHTKSSRLRSVSLSPTKRRGAAESPTAELDDSDLSTPSKRAELVEELYRRMYKRRRRRPSRTRSRRYGSLTTDDSYLSDGIVDYGDEQSEGGYTGDFAGELAGYKRDIERRGRAVRLEDVLDEAAPGRVGGVRRRLKNEDQRTRVRSQFLKDTYGQSLVDFEEQMKETMNKLKEVSKDVHKDYQKQVLKNPQSTKPSRKHKVPGSVLYPRNKSGRKTTTPSRNTSSARYATPASHRTSTRPLSDQLYDNEVLPYLLEEFPFLHISSQSLHNMWQRSAQQIQALTKSDVRMRGKKTKQQQAVEEAEWKQKLLGEIAKKEVEHTKRLRELEDRRKEQQAVKASVRDKRQQHARVRKYYEEYSVRMRSKMLKKRTREEMVFKKLLEDGLKIQKERIRELRKYARDQRDERTERHKNELDSMENYYRDRFSMLGDALKQEHQDRKLKSKAQQQAMSSLNRELRQKTEREIESIQDAIFRDDDDVYFRELDADRLKQELQLARYKALV